MTRTAASLPAVGADQIVADVLATWPQTIRVFLDHQMACVGCAMASFETVAEVAANYGHSLDSFMAALRAAISSERAP